MEQDADRETLYWLQRGRRVVQNPVDRGWLQLHQAALNDKKRSRLTPFRCEDGGAFRLVARASTRGKKPLRLRVHPVEGRVAL